MEIQITQKQCGGTEFLARPHRLHLGAQNAAGVDQLHFILPEAWAGCSAALYLRRADGTLLAPVSLDGEGRVTVDRRLTGSTGGQWMLAAIRGEDYTAYTRPGSYDTYAILPTDGGTEEQKYMLAFAVNGCFGTIVAWQEAGFQPPAAEIARITWQAIRAVKGRM